MRSASQQNSGAETHIATLGARSHRALAAAIPAAPAPGSLPLAFAGLWLFTLLLCVRPNDVFPELFGDFQLAKLIAVPTLLVYLFGRLLRGESLTIWTTELKMVLLIWCLGALFLPLAASPSDSWEALTEIYLKVVLIFFLLVNLLDTRRRLDSILKLVVVWGTVLSLNAVRNFASGQFIKSDEQRIQGLVSGIFGNPNDLATALDLLLPLAVALALNRRGAGRVFYLLCAVITGMGIVATFSRGGFLGMLAVGVVLLWKFGRSRRTTALVTVVMVLMAFVLFMPGQYSSRIFTIVSTEQDSTGSAQERRELLKRATSIALHHPVIGVGMGNFHIYSLREKVAHNSYLEIAAELGLLGLLAYLVLILTPLRSTRRVERETRAALAASPGGAWEVRQRESYHLSVALQAAFAAYLVCSLFASVQYQWFLYYIAAYAIAIRRIHAIEQRAAEASETPASADGPTSILPPTQRVRPRTRLGLLAWSNAVTDGAANKISVKS